MEFRQRIRDILDRLGNPDATTLARISNEAIGEFQVWLRDRKNRRMIPPGQKESGS